MKNCVYVPIIICIYYNGDTVINETKNGTNYAINLIARTGIEGRNQNGVIIYGKQSCFGGYAIYKKYSYFFNTVLFMEQCL